MNQSESLRTLHDVRKEHIRRALEACDHDETKAAEALGISVGELRENIDVLLGFNAQTDDSTSSKKRIDER